MKVNLQGMDAPLYVNFYYTPDMTRTICLVSSDPDSTDVYKVGHTVKSKNMQESYDMNVARKVSMTRAIASYPTEVRKQFWLKYHKVFQPQIFNEIERRQALTKQTSAV